MRFFWCTGRGQSHVCSWLPNKEGCIHDWYDSGTLESHTCLCLHVVQTVSLMLFKSTEGFKKIQVQQYNSDFITSGSAALGFEFLGLLKATRSTSFSNFSSDLSPMFFGCLTSLGRTIGSFRGDLEHERAFSRIDWRQPHKCVVLLMWATPEKLPPALWLGQQTKAPESQHVTSTD